MPVSDVAWCLCTQQQHPPCDFAAKPGKTLPWITVSSRMSEKLYFPDILLSINIKDNILDLLIVSTAPRVKLVVSI